MSRRLIAALSVGVLVIAAMLSHSRNEPDRDAPGDFSIRAIGALQPRLSPDGNTIAFSYQGAIWTMPATGGAMQRITDGPDLDSEPTWSADSRHIAYIQSRNFTSGPLRVSVAKDAWPIMLPGGVHASGKLAFHPDGKRILGSFTSQDVKVETLAWFDMNSGELQQIVNPPRSIRRAALSADGKWIAYATHQDVTGQQWGNDGVHADLWKVSANGGQPEKIGQWPARIHDLCWTADGKNMIVTTDLGGAHYDLWQLPLDDPSRGQKLTFGQADEDRPGVSVDGRWLLYTDNREGVTSLVRRNLRSGNEQTLNVSGVDYLKPTGSIKLRLADKSNGKPMVARVSLIDKGGKFYAPPGAMYRNDRGNAHIYCRESAEFRLPAGEYQLRIWRGPEYAVLRQDLKVEDGKTVEVAAKLERWFDAASFNLYSGENHIHANYGYGEWYNTPETMLLQCEGEDLNVCNFMVANSDGDGVFDRPFFRGRPDPLSKPRTILYWNEEYRSTIWGHMTLLNLKHLVEPIFTGFKGTTNPYDVPTNADSAKRTRDQGGFASYTHAAQNPSDPYLNPYTGKGIPVDVALGHIDSMDLNNSYPGCLVLWYRLLNCGFRLPASAGTDCFLNRVSSRLPGSDRCYVRIEGELTYAKWIEGLRAGRSFVTNGPAVEIIVDGRHRQGDTVKLNAPGKIKIVGKAWCNLPLRRVEIIQDGKVAATRMITDKSSPEKVWETELPIERSGWIAIRASGPAHPDIPGGEAFAHTSPVYVEVAGKPVSARDDAEFFLKWIDRLDLALRERNRYLTPTDKAHANAQLDAARAVYLKLAGK
jgi:hypothetical protein